jgi:hypothetical protein
MWHVHIIMKFFLFSFISCVWNLNCSCYVEKFYCCWFFTPLLVFLFSKFWIEMFCFFFFLGCVIYIFARQFFSSIALGFSDFLTALLVFFSFKFWIECFVSFSFVGCVIYIFEKHFFSSIALGFSDFLTPLLVFFSSKFWIEMFYFLFACRLCYLYLCKTKNFIYSLKIQWLNPCNPKARFDTKKKSLVVLSPTPCLPM